MIESTQVIPNWLSGYISKEGLEKVEQAVAEVEKKTNGEIVPVVVESSSTMRVPFGAFAVLLYLVIAVTFYFIQQLDAAADLSELQSSLLFATLIVLGTGALFLFRDNARLVRYFNREQQEQNVWMRAQIEFYKTRVHHTEAATGVLVFVSVFERKAVVLGDDGISEKISQDEWDGALRILIQHLKQKDLATGMSQAIEILGNKLATHFPKTDDNQNELHNHLIVKS